jgi:hypothetical protein
LNEQSGFGLEINSRRDPLPLTRYSSYLPKLALTSQTDGDRSVVVALLQTKIHGVCFVLRFEVSAAVTIKNTEWCLLGCYVRRSVTPPSSGVFLHSVHRLLVTANVPSSPILVTLMMKAPSSSETSVFIGATRLYIPEDCILLIYFYLGAY